MVCHLERTQLRLLMPKSQCFLEPFYLGSVSGRRVKVKSGHIMKVWAKLREKRYKGKDFRSPDS